MDELHIAALMRGRFGQPAQNGQGEALPDRTNAAAEEPAGQPPPAQPEPKPKRPPRPRRADRPQKRLPEGMLWRQEKNGEWAMYARFAWTDSRGRKRRKEKKVSTQTEGRDWLLRQRLDLEQKGGEVFDARQITFREAAVAYKAKKLIPPVIVDGRKVAGLRSWRSPQDWLETLIEYFGPLRLADLKYQAIADYKLARLRTPTRQGTPRKIASVNRELQLLRAMLNWCVRERLLDRNPFSDGEPLIAQSEETHRDRLATPEEEAAILAVCTGRRAHLRAILLAARDTGMRKGEIRKLRWKNVLFEQGVIVAEATTTKTQRQRIVPLTDRLIEALSEMRSPDASPEDLVFPDGDFKKAWRTACRLAGVTGLRFHDLRHTAITEIVSAGVPDELAMKVSGHTQRSTFSRYVNVDLRIAQQIGEALSALRRGAGKDEPDEGQQK
ncbi:MAG TPA: site-specific integrase [Blastocatellia bacterium]|nr:site-specific integrase [Blastocatellia bacterium]